MPDRTAPRELVASALQRLVDRLGVDAVMDGGVRGLVADELGADSTRCRAELDAIARAADARVPMKLREGATTEVVERDVGRGTADEDETRWAVAAWSAVVPPPAPPDRQMLVTTAAQAPEPRSELQVQASPARRSGLRMVIAGLVVGTILALGVGAFMISQDTTRSRLALQTGQCFNGGTDEDPQVELVSCEDLHDGVTIETYRLGQVNDPYPGQSEAQEEADVCTTFETASNREMAGYVPDQDAWESGRRNVICVERSSSGSPLPAE